MNSRKLYLISVVLVIASAGAVRLRVAQANTDAGAYPGSPDRRSNPGAPDRGADAGPS